MRKDSLLILSLAACAGGTSMLYFLSLAAQLPFTVTVLLAAGCCIILLNTVRKDFYPAPVYTWLSIAALTTGLLLITYRTYHLGNRWGDWDAWGIWNYHARFLMDSQRWTNLFKSVQYDHPDYPLGLPALLAFIGRICGGHGMLHVSFALHYLTTLGIPLLIFLLLQRKNFIIATAILLLFATDEFYLHQGISQFADTMLAAYFLMALISIGHSATDSRMIAASAFFAGCAAWTKNEGIVLALMFFLFYMNVFFSRKNLRFTLMGIVLPLLTLILFKVFYAPTNDLLQNSNGGLMQQLSDAHRYELVWSHFRKNGSDYFMWTGIGLLPYALTCILQKRWPERPMLLLLACLGVYMATYILTPYDPEWHLATSQNRLMHQLMPAFVYLIGLRLCEYPLPWLRSNADKP